MNRKIYPFPAIVGQDELKKALVLNVINPSVSGVLIRGEKGTAKSTAVRSLAEILPEIDIVPECPYNLSPEDSARVCQICGREECSENKRSVRRRVPVVELPVGATEDRVVGALNLEHALKGGERRFEPGLLAWANRGILYVDEVNLLEDHIVDVLLDSAAMGVNTVEREGISFSHPARFTLVGTMNPEEGELRPQLLDRFGLCVTVSGMKDAEKRVEVIERRLAFEENPEKFMENWQAECDLLRDKITAAKALLPLVEADRTSMMRIAVICMEAEVDGHRADIIMLKTAKTLAAWNGRKAVSDEDILEAAKFVLPHRMRRQPLQQVGRT
jgi:magnesium chelatase subunit I